MTIHAFNLYHILTLLAIINTWNLYHMVQYASAFLETTPPRPACLDHAAIQGTGCMQPSVTLPTHIDARHSPRAKRPSILTELHATLDILLLLIFRSQIPFARRQLPK